MFFSPAYRTEDIEELDRICDHIIFNSTAQLKKFKEVCTGASLGLRINPECSTQGDHAIYDPVRRVPGWGLPERTLTGNV